MKAHSATTAAVVVCLLLAGCAQDGTLSTNGLNTSSIEQKKAAEQAEKNNAECMAIASQIETLHRDGAAAKVTKAASKKYKMKAADLAKADELNKANAEFQGEVLQLPAADHRRGARGDARPRRRDARRRACRRYRSRRSRSRPCRPPSRSPRHSRRRPPRRWRSLPPPPSPEPHLLQQVVLS